MEARYDAAKSKMETERQAELERQVKDCGYSKYLWHSCLSGPVVKKVIDIYQGLKF